jgi:hypothetical protein
MRRYGFAAFVWLTCLLQPVSGLGNPLVNPGFESVGARGELEGWSILFGLDEAGYGAPGFERDFDPVIPTRGAGGQDGSAHCLAFPARGRWFCPIFTHSMGDGKPGNDGRLRGKAAAYQTVPVEPGRYRFGAWLRTADGDAWSAAFRLGWSTVTPPRYAHDGSTGISWSREALGEKRDRLGTLRDRGEWVWYETDPFEIRDEEKLTVWIRFDYVNENQFYARWQADNAAVLRVDDSAGALLGTIWGIVKDDQDMPIPGARITLSGSDHTATSAGNGTFTLRSVPPGSHRIEASKEGWRVAVIEPDPVEIEEAGDGRVEIVMRPMRPFRSWRDVTDVYFHNTAFEMGPGEDSESCAFGWAFRDLGPNGICGVDRATGRAGPSLQLGSFGEKSRVFQNSTRIVAGPPAGPYRLLIWLKTSHDYLARHASVRLLVIDRKENVLASSEAAVDPSPTWRQIRTGEVQVPDEEGELRLRIELSPGSAGVVWFDEVVLETAGER